MRQGLVILSQDDADAPDLPAIGTVSKTDSWEDGGFALGQDAAATLGAAWVDRPYFTGNPSDDWLLAQIDRATGAGARAVQVGNELNLATEGWQGGAVAYWEQLARLQAARPQAVLLHQPPSPGVPGWESWVDPVAPDQAVHCYGTVDQMWSVVSWYLANTSGALWVTECNPGAGQTFDLDEWAERDLVAFLDRCSTEPRVKVALYFAWRWDQSPQLPSSVDAAGTLVETVLQDWVPPVGGGSGDVEWYPGATPRPIAVNYTPGRAAQPITALVMHVADGLGSPFGWFNTPRGEAGSSAHFWIAKSGAVEQYRPLSDTCWANGPVCEPDDANPAVGAILVRGVDPNAVTVAVEHEGYPGDVFPDAQVAASAALVSWLANLYGLGLSRDWVIEHGQLDSCTRADCPGPSFPWGAVLGEPAPDLAGIQARTWDACDELQALAAEWDAAGWPSAGVGVSSAAEAIKSLVRASKGER